MKKLLLLPISFVALWLYGQESNQFSVSMGSAIPLANFQETDINDINSGYAKNGRSIQLMYAKQLAKGISLRFTVTDVLNKMDNEPEIQAYLDATQSRRKVSIRNRVWTSTSAFLGVAKKIDFSNDNYSLEPSVNVGYSRVRRPNLLVSNHVDDPYIAQSELESRSSSLSVLLGLSNYYQLNKLLRFFISLEYFATSPEFDFTRYPITDKNSSTSPQEISYTQDIRLFMINGGLGVTF